MMRVPVSCLACGAPYLLARAAGFLVQQPLCPLIVEPGRNTERAVAAEHDPQDGDAPQPNQRIPRRSCGWQPRSCVPMNECAVIWRESRDPERVYAGGITLEAQSARLRGSAQGVHVAHEISAGDVLGVERVHGAERLAGRPSLRVALRSGASLLIAGVAVGGSLGVFDIADALAAMALRVA